MKPIVQERLVDEVYQQLREYIFQNNHTTDQRIDIEKIAERRFQVGQGQEHGS